MQNYAIALHSAILVDVGSTAALSAGLPNTNILTNVTALKERIQTDDLFETHMTETNGSANGIIFDTPAAPFVLSYPSEFRLPIPARRLIGDSTTGSINNDPGPAKLVQRYLCHSLVLKPMSTLVVDVLVATMSMFMFVWGLAHMGLMYVAKEHTINGNYCTCPACDTHTKRLALVTPASPNTVNTPGEKDLAVVESA